MEDSGLGIVQEQREAMFKPFVRGAQTRGEGLGLGLSLVKRICEQETWRIEVLPGTSSSRFKVTVGSA